MYLLWVFELRMSPQLVGMVDALLLAIILAPIFWWLVVRPLRAGVVAEQDRTAAIIRGAFHGVVTIDEAGAIQSVNPKAEVMFGYREGELLGKPVTMLMPERYRQAHVAVLERTRLARERGFTPRVMETHGLSKDGNEFPIEISIAGWQSEVGRGCVGFLRDITDRKRTEEELLRLRRAVEASDAVVIMTDADGILRFVNPAFTKVYGYEPEQVVGITTPRILKSGVTPPEDYEALWQAITAKAVVRREFINKTKSGRLIPVEASVNPVLAEDGTIVGFLAIQKDITERRNAEDALRESEADFKEAQRVAHVGSWDWNATTDTTSWSEERCRIFGWDPKLPTPGYEQSLRLYAPESAARLDAAVKHALQTGAPFELDLEILRLDGTRRWITARGEVRRDATGQIVGLRGTTHDITERKLMEDALRRSERHYRTLVENLPQRIFLKDRKLAYVSVNEQFARDYGFKAVEVAGKTGFDVFPRQRAEKHHADDVRIMASGKTEELDEEYVEQGERRVAHAVKTPVRDEQGKVTGILGISWDVTESVKLEEQYRQAQKMEAVGRLAGGIAHDFNNLLTVILGFTSLAFNELSKDSPARKDLAEAFRAGESAMLLAKQLLAFSRKQALQLVVLDLNDVITGIEGMLRPLTGESVQLLLHLASTLDAVKADAGQMEQVIMNLAVNARDAMLAGGSLTIETSNVQLDEASRRQHPEVVPGRYVRLAVTDTGTGMDAETLRHVFEPFFTTKEVGRGTGLGLSTVYGIVKQSGGYVYVRSEVGRGSTFEVFLPSTLEKIAPSLLSAREETSLLRGAETVLLVEDDAIVRRLAHRILTGCGYAILEAHDGEEAILLSSRYGASIDLLLTDIVMPKMDGQAVARRVREHRPTIKILYMSGYVAGQMLIDADTPFLAKPFTPDALACAVRTALAASGSGQVTA